MGKLIDADVLIDSVPEVRYPDEKISRNAAIRDCIELIWDAPVAYDVKGVVEQLKNLLKEYKNVSYNEMSKLEVAESIGAEKALKMAIEIVYKGIKGDKQ